MNDYKMDQKKRKKVVNPKVDYWKIINTLTQNDNNNKINDTITSNKTEEGSSLQILQKLEENIMNYFFKSTCSTNLTLSEKVP